MNVYGGQRYMPQINRLNYSPCFIQLKHRRIKLITAKVSSQQFIFLML